MWSDFDWTRFLGFFRPSPPTGDDLPQILSDDNSCIQLTLEFICTVVNNLPAVNEDEL